MGRCMRFTEAGTPTKNGELVAGQPLDRIDMIFQDRFEVRSILCSRIAHSDLDLS